MSMQIEKTVFISYRRTNIFFARAIFQNLRSNGYDVFLDYESINSGAFGKIILNQVRARAHFLVLLTPSALERCSEPSDWLRREIETAIDEKRNIVPLYLEGFDFGDIKKYLPTNLHILSAYNALRIPADYFEEALSRLRDRFLNKPLKLILHPTPASEQQIVDERITQQATEPIVEEQELTATEFFEFGLEACNTGDYKTAITHYTKSIQLNPNSASTYSNRGAVYREMKQYDQAIADFDQAFILDPQHVNAFNNRSLVYIDLDNYIQAIADLDQAIALDPYHTISLVNRGATYNKLGKYNIAIDDLNQAIALDPQDSDAYNNRANSYRELKQYHQAISDYDKAIMLNPSDAHDAYYNRGNTYYDLKQYALAITDYSKAITFDVEDINAYYKLGMAHFNLNQFDEAIASFDNVIALNPNNAALYNNRGWIYFCLEQYDDAISNYETALRIDPNFDKARDNLALAKEKVPGE